MFLAAVGRLISSVKLLIKYTGLNDSVNDSSWGNKSMKKVI